MVDDSRLAKAVQAVEMGEYAKAQRLLVKVVQEDRDSEMGWWWLSQIVDDQKRKRDCLRQVLRINSYNHEAQNALAVLEGRDAPPAAPRDEPLFTPPASGSMAIDDFSDVFGGDSDAVGDASAETSSSLTRRRLITRPQQSAATESSGSVSSALSESESESFVVSASPSDEERPSLVARLRDGALLVLERVRAILPEKSMQESDMPSEFSIPTESNMPAETAAPVRLKILERRALFGIVGLPLAIILLLSSVFFALRGGGGPASQITANSCKHLDVEAFTAETVTTGLGGTLSGDRLYNADTTYYFDDDLVVPVGGRLLVQPGATLIFAQGKALDVRGELYVCGTERSAVTFTGAQDEPGSWVGLRFYAADSNTVLNHAVVKNAAERALYFEGSAPILTDVTVSGSARFPLSIDGQTLPTFENLNLTDNPFQGIEVRAGVLRESIVWSDYGWAYVVSGPLEIADEATLEIVPEATVKFWQAPEAPLAGLLVHGLLKAEQVIFTSAYDSRDVAAGVTYFEARDPQPGDWGGIHFSESSAKSTLRESMVMYAGYRQGAVSLHASSPDMISTTVSLNAWYPVSMDAASFPALVGLTLQDNDPGDAVEILGGSLGGREVYTWTYLSSGEGQIVRVVRGTLLVEPEATLLVEPGVVVKFEPRGKLIVRGTLDSVGGGTRSGQIVFTSLRDDEYGGVTDKNTGPQDQRAWGGIILDGVDETTALQNSIVRYASVWVLDGSPRLLSTQVLDSDAAGIKVTPWAQPEFGGNQLRGNALDGVLVLPGRISADQEWVLMGDKDDQIVRILSNDVSVAEDATLVIGPGAVVKALPGAELRVLGGLRALGKTHLPIVFTSLEDAASGGATVKGFAEASAGDWRGLIIGPQADVSFGYTSIKYARYALILRGETLPLVEEGRLQLTDGEHSLWCAGREQVPDSYLVENNNFNETRCPSP